MKKLLTSLLMIFLVISILTGCGGDGSKTAEKENVSEKEEMISEEVDFSSYEEIEVNTVENKSLKVYYNPEVIVDWYTEYAICVAYDEEGKEYPFEVVPFESAEEYRSSEIFEHEMWEHQNIEATELEEISVGGHTVHSFNIKYQDDLTGEPIDYSSDIGIIELDNGLVFCFSLGNEGIEEVLSAITFTKEQDSASAADESGNVADSNSENAERDLQTCGILDMKIDNTGNVTHEETGILTYDAGKVEYISTDEYGVEFDVRIKQDKKTNILPATLSIVNDENMEEYYQRWKNDTLEFDANAEVSEMKETVINEIPVEYFTRVYHSKDGEHENRDLYCFIDFPTIDNREKAIQIWMPYKLEEELHLNSLKDLLIDIEIQGVKPVGIGEETVIAENITVEGAPVESTPVKNTDVENNQEVKNTYNYSAEEKVVTMDGKTVKIYYDPNVITSWNIVDASTIIAYNKNNDRCVFLASDFATAEDYRNDAIRFYGDSAKITEIEEKQMGGHTVHAFRITDDQEVMKHGAIEIGSGVVFGIDYMHTKEGVNIGEVLGAMKFEVE